MISHASVYASRASARKKRSSTARTAGLPAVGRAVARPGRARARSARTASRSATSPRARPARRAPRRRRGSVRSAASASRVDGPPVRAGWRPRRRPRRRWSRASPGGSGATWSPRASRGGLPGVEQHAAAVRRRADASRRSPAGEPPQCRAEHRDAVRRVLEHAAAQQHGRVGRGAAMVERGRTLRGADARSGDRDRRERQRVGRRVVDRRRRRAIGDRDQVKRVFGQATDQPVAPRPADPGPVRVHPVVDECDTHDLAPLVPEGTTNHFSHRIALSWLCSANPPTCRPIE